MWGRGSDERGGNKDKGGRSNEDQGIKVETDEVIIDNSSEEGSNSSVPGTSEIRRDVCRKSTGTPQFPTYCGRYDRGLFQEDTKFMDNFDPEKSCRNQLKKKKRYNQDGRLIQYADDYEDCDCLQPHCSGCHFPCKSCGDRRCGHECRKGRRWLYEVVEIEGKTTEFRNPHMSSYT